MIFASYRSRAPWARFSLGINGQGLTLPKGRKLTEADVASLSRAGHRGGRRRSSEAGDVPEDKAAATVAASLAGAGVSIAPAATGRANTMLKLRGWRS